MENARIEATLSGERMQRGGYEIKALTAAGEWAEQKLNLTQFEWTDTGGVFSPAGRAGMRGRTAADFQARSSVNAKQLLEAFGFGKYRRGRQPSPRRPISSSPAPSISPRRLRALQRDRPGHGGKFYLQRTCRFSSSAADFSWDGAAHDAARRARAPCVRRTARRSTGRARRFSPQPRKLDQSRRVSRAGWTADLRQISQRMGMAALARGAARASRDSRDPQKWNGEGTIAVAAHAFPRRLDEQRQRATFISRMARSPSTISALCATKAWARGRSPTIQCTTKCGIRTCEDHAAADRRDLLDRAKALQGRRALQIPQPADSWSQTASSNIAAARTPSRDRRSMRRPGWITSFSARRCRSSARTGNLLITDDRVQLS